MSNISVNYRPRQTQYKTKPDDKSQHLKWVPHWETTHNQGMICIYMNWFWLNFAGRGYQYGTPSLHHVTNISHINNTQEDPAHPDQHSARGNGKIVETCQSICTTTLYYMLWYRVYIFICSCNTFENTMSPTLSYGGSCHTHSHTYTHTEMCHHMQVFTSIS
jgi:hypothetical protein